MPPRRPEPRRRADAAKDLSVRKPGLPRSVAVTPDLLSVAGTAGLAEALFDGLPDVVFFVKDRDGRYRAVNRTLVERCGLRSKADLLGRTPGDVFPEPLGRGYAEQDRLVLERGVALRDQLELHLLGPRRPGWCLTTKLPLLDARGQVVGMAGFSKDLPRPDRQDAVYRQVARAVEHLRARHAEPLRIRDVARQAGLTPRRLERLVRRVFHLTPGQLLVQARLDSACRLLAGTDRKVAEVAQACGYGDQSAFTRQFRATVGLTPSAFRRRAR